MPKPSTTQKVKEVAEGFITKFRDSLDSKKGEEDESPPKPPPKRFPMPALSKPNNAVHSAQSFIQSFSGLSLSNSSKPVAYEAPVSVAPEGQDGNFIGGFHPGYLSGNTPPPPPLHHAWSAPPPTMPSPLGLSPLKQQSLTMQMALLQDLDSPARPSSAPQLTPFSESDLEEIRPIYTPSTTKPKKNGRLSAPVTPNKVASGVSPGGSSAPSTPSEKETQLQCAGTTKAGKRCTRTVKAAPALSQMIDDNSDDGENLPLERFCFQHTKELLSPSGCYARKNGEWIDFNDWIPGYLQVETRLSLRIEMERPRSQSDIDGYIYTFEIRAKFDGQTESRSCVNLVKRIDQWGKQCGSKEQVLRGYYPGPEAQGDEGLHVSLMKGRVKAGEKASCCHRLERLIHLELADLVATCVYLDPAWPANDLTGVPASATTGKKTGSLKKVERCTDCGSMHKEIFEFQRWTQGSNKNQEWEKIVKPVIERWGKFVELYV